MPVKKTKSHGPHPIYGMEGTKPGAGNFTNHPKGSTPQTLAQANRKYDLAYKKARVRQMRFKALREGMKLAIERDEPIQRKLAEQQMVSCWLTSKPACWQFRIISVHGWVAGWVWARLASPDAGQNRVG